MKKLLTLATLLFLLLAGASAISAKPPKKKKHKPAATLYEPVPQYNGYYNRRGVYIYHSTRIVWRRNGRYRNTYKHKVFPNGRMKTRLINSVRIRPHRYGHGRVRVFYRTKTVYRGWKAYRVTYKIKRYPNGRVKRKIVHIRRIYLT